MILLNLLMIWNDTLAKICYFSLNSMIVLKEKYFVFNEKFFSLKIFFS